MIFNITNVLNLKNIARNTKNTTEKNFIRKNIQNSSLDFHKIYN